MMSDDTELGTVSSEVPFGTLVRGAFVRRDNRFRVQVALGDTTVAVHLANPGRLRELLVPGREVWVRPAPAPHRRTGYDLVLVAYAGYYVSLNSQLPNRLVAQALRWRQLPWFEDYPVIRSEVRLGESRLDFKLEGEGAPCWIEVKSVTLVVDNVARFPDAPTARGRRHLRELIDVAAQGARAAVIFVVQRADAASFAPNDGTDPAFGEALRRAYEVGVVVYALRCDVTTTAIRLRNTIPVRW